MSIFTERYMSLRILAELLKTELVAGVLGLRLFLACVVVATVMLASVWLLGQGLSGALDASGPRILGGDLAISVVNVSLDQQLLQRLAELGTLSRVAELRTSATANNKSLTVELKAVDANYPLFGSLEVHSEAPFYSDLQAPNESASAVVDRSLLTHLGIELGDTLQLGSTPFIVRALIAREPDRLSSGRFMVGPRVLVSLNRLPETGLTGVGSLIDYRYRLRLDEAVDMDSALKVLEQLKPDHGWEVETPGDAAERVRRTIERTTTFLGMAGIVALIIGLSGAWASAQVWVSRRSKTIALYRLSGATPNIVVWLHGTIIALSGGMGLGLGLLLAVVLVYALMEQAVAQLHLRWDVFSLFGPALQVSTIMAIGLVGASFAALSSAAKISPGAAMRSGEAQLTAHPRHVCAGAIIVALAVLIAVLSLPDPKLAGTAAAGLICAVGLLGLGGWLLARQSTRIVPRRFTSLVILQGLSLSGAVAIKVISIGIGIAGITAIVAAQSSLENALRSELPDKIPDLVLLDVQQHQVDALKSHIEQDVDLGGLQSSPFMRTHILAVNDVPAAKALVLERKSWVIEGDRSFAWTAEATGAELLAGEWWAPDYTGPPLVSAEEDLAEAFDLQPGDKLTYSVLGRTFSSEVVNIRKEYHRTFRPEFLLVASPEPFQNAPHSWVMSLEANNDPAVDGFIRHLQRSYPNITTIDVRPIVSAIRDILDGAILASLIVAMTLLMAGALSLTAVIAADVDGRRCEALAFTLIGASRREIGLARLGEAASIGVLAALIGGLGGLLGGYWLTQEALHISWQPGVLAWIIPVLLGLVAALVAGTAGGLGALPRGRGEVARHLAN
jgi:putative ABC transport system permease protein